VKFVPTQLPGAFIVEIEPRADDRGFFGRSFCVREFQSQGIPLSIVQSNVAFTHRAGTVRGLHYQVPPSLETKLMRCTRGAIYDVIVDMRPESPTYLKYLGVELTAENRRALFVPALFAHGYQSLKDESEVTYLVSQFYEPALERGMRYDDPAVGIQWPQPVTVVSDKDVSWPFLKAR